LNAEADCIKEISDGLDGVSLSKFELLILLLLSSDEVEKPDVDEAEEVVDSEAGLKLELSLDLDV
jgi:hypothetical protein